MSDFISDQDFKPDEAMQVAANSSPNAPSFVPDNQFEADEEKHASPLEMYKAGVEAIERGATLGVSDLYRTKVEAPAMKALGLPDSLVTTQQDLAGRKAGNPGLETAGNIIGGGVLLGATGGLGPLAEGLGTAAKIGSMAAEGAAFGGGNALSEYALGDPSLTASKAWQQIGMGALLGGSLGVLSKGVEAGIPALKNALKSVRGSSETAENLPVSSVVDDAQVTSDAPQSKGVQPTTYQEIADRVKAARYTGESLDLPQKEILQDAISRVEMQNPVHPLQMDSLSNQQQRDAYKAAQELGSEGGALRDYESLQKNELNSKTDTAIKDLSPGAMPTPDAIEGGNRAIEHFTKQYQAEKKAIAPMFEKFKLTPIQTQNALPDLVSKMTDEVPGIAKMFDTDAADLSIKKYNSGMGIDKDVYNAVKESIEGIKENPEADFSTLQSIRNRLKQHVDIFAQGEGPAQIRSLGKAMMDYMQDAVQESHPEMAVREAFKRYAINEQERAVIEKAFGASVGSPEFGALSKIKPEQIGDRIFANSASVNAVKQILEPKQFNELLANWISEAKAAATDKGAFSSNKFGSWMKRNQDALNTAFADSPQSLQRLKDLTTIMRILPDSASINPSGTAKTLIAGLKGVHSVTDLAGAIGKIIKEKTVDEVNRQVALSNLNNQLAGKAANATLLSEIKNMASKTTDSINRGAKGIFSDNFNRGGVLGASIKALDGSYDKKVEKIQKYSSNPQAFMDHLAQTTEPLHNAAPNVVQGLNNSLVKSVQFLDSKLPKPVVELPLSAKFEPSVAQRRKFLRYYAAVENPVGSLAEVKNGTLSNETMEALVAVHPELLNEMQQAVMENIHPEKAKNLNYATKISISKFLGRPMDVGLLPQVIMANQMAFAAPQPQQQGGGKSTQKGLEKLNPGKLAATRTQKLEESDA